MKIWMFGLGLALLCSVHAQIECSGGERELEGTWHVIALGSNCNDFLKHKNSMKMVAASLSVTEEGNFKVTSKFPTPNGCRELEMDFDKIGNGMYTHTSESSKETVEIVKTNCEDYAITLVEMEKNGKTSTLVVIYARGREVSQEIMDQFIAVAENKGLTSDQIIFFPPEVDCENES